jgi:hypothetical protein
VRDRAPEALALAVAALAAAAGCVLAAGSRRPAAAAARSAEFQRAVGGLGSGTAASLSPCEAAFDRGVAAGCSRAFWPVAGGAGFCPHHGGPSLRR